MPWDWQDPPAPTCACLDCVAYHAYYQKAAYLLEQLAADHFANQGAFHLWLERQSRIVLFGKQPEAGE